MAKETPVQTGDAKEPVQARTADVKHKDVGPSGQHASVEPTEADYEKARTVGIGNEPELPPGVVRGN